MLAFSAALLLESLRLPFGTIHSPGEGFYPSSLSVILALLSALLLVRALLSRRPPAPAQHGHVRRVAALLAGLAVYALLLEPVGYPICTFGLVLALLPPRTGTEALASVVLAGLASGVSYVVFAVWLKVPLPPGLLGG